MRLGSHRCLKRLKRKRSNNPRMARRQKLLKHPANTTQSRVCHRSKRCQNNNLMELQEFIKTALSEIIAGVAEASQLTKKHGGKAGSMKLYGHVKDNKIMTDENDRPVTTVEFDIALAEGKSKDTKGGIGVYLGAMGLGSQGASHGETSTHSRIRFTVPIVLPDAKG